MQGSWSLAAVSALALVAAALPSAGGARERVLPVLDHPGNIDPLPERLTRFPGGVTGSSDIVYSTLPGYRPLILDLYRVPGANAAPRPLVIYIHGGGWVAGTTRNAGAIANFPAALAGLASEGFVVASVEYRLAGEAAFPAQLQDVRAAIRFLKANAPKYGIDPARVAIWGGSAGGHLAALAALSCGVPGIDAKPQPVGSECVQAAVTWYGVFDFAPLVARVAGDPAGARLMGCTGACDPAKVAAASPVSYIDGGDPPFLLIHGEADKTVDVSQSHRAEALLKAAGVPVESIYLPGIDHSFIGATPADTRAATLKAVNATFDYFHRKLDLPAR